MTGDNFERALILVEFIRKNKVVTSEKLQQEYRDRGIERHLRTCQRDLCVAESYLDFDEWRKDPATKSGT